MDAMYRMLADAHRADLEREARQRRLVAVARAARADADAAPGPARRWSRWSPPRLAMRLLVGPRH
jgi:hypothetical protein